MSSGVGSSGGPAGHRDSAARPSAGAATAGDVEKIRRGIVADPACIGVWFCWVVGR